VVFTFGSGKTFATGERFSTKDTKARKFEDDLNSGYGIRPWMVPPVNIIPDVKFVYSHLQTVFYVDSTGNCESKEVAKQK
jgi:hypothetical protein